MKEKKQGMNINAKSFIGALIVIFVLMIGTYILTFLIPGGAYERVADAEGNQVINPDAFQSVTGGLPFWKWILSPILVLGAEGSGTIIAVLVFLLVVGGIFNALGKSGLMQYMLDRIVDKFGERRERLLSIIMLFFMAMGAFIGSYEECVPLVPLVVAVCVGLGYDALTGLLVSLLAAGCGFASGVCNPFTVGVAQELAGVPMFSGLWLRAVSFILIYGLLLLFVLRHVKKIGKSTEKIEGEVFKAEQRFDKGLKAFAIILGCGILIVLCSGIVPALQDYTMIIVSLMFLVAGITSVKLTGMKWGSFGREFLEGITSVLPAVLMILMASSIKYILVEGNILDTILHWAVTYADGLQPWMIVLFIYLLVLVMNFFIASGSAKAFLLIPLIVPLAQTFHISPQICVLAFAFGDGFSNVFYPTNPVLLISLGLADTSYGTWVKKTWTFQAVNLIVTSAILLFGFAIGYH